MGNPKEWEAGEMSGEELRNHPFQEKRGGSRCKVREAGAEVWSPPPLSLKTLVLRFQGCVCHCRRCAYMLFLLVWVAFLFFCFVFSEKEKAQTLLKLFE